MSSRFILPALCISLAVHVGAFGLMALKQRAAARSAATTATPLLALLRPLPKPPAKPPAPEITEPDALLKNTLPETPPEALPETPSELPKPSKPPKKIITAPKASTASSTKPTKRQLEAAKQQISQYVFYPRSALEQGHEGRVVLYVELSTDGRVNDVRLVSSSGYPTLDNAAIKGFYAVGRLPGQSGQWDYIFQLAD